MLPYPITIVYLIWGNRTIIIKHHILKHHIPELPNNSASPVRAPPAQVMGVPCHIAISKY